MLESRVGCVSQSVTGQSACRPIYDRDQLLSLYTTTDPGASVVTRLRSLGLYVVCRPPRRRRRGGRPSSSQREDRFTVGCSYRGCRAGRSRRSAPVICSTGCGAFILVASGGPSPHVDRLQSRPRPPSSLVKVRVERHSSPRYVGMSFGCLNIRSLGNKLDDLLEVRRDRQIDVMFLAETWHNSLVEVLPLLH